MTAYAGRLGQLLVGLVLFGAGLWLGLQAALGVGPWDVLHGGLVGAARDAVRPHEHRGGRRRAAVVAVLSGVRAGGRHRAQRPGRRRRSSTCCWRRPLLDGLGDGALGRAAARRRAAASRSSRSGRRSTSAPTSVPGPRDGLMVAISQRTGWGVGTARGVLECAVLLLGVLLGGPVGPGTVVFALGHRAGRAARLPRPAPDAGPAPGGGVTAPEPVVVAPPAG